MMNLMLHSLQPFHGAVNFILAQFYLGVYKGDTMSLLVRVSHPQGALGLSDRSLHRFDQAIHFLSR